MGSAASIGLSRDNQWSILLAIILRSTKHSQKHVQHINKRWLLFVSIQTIMQGLVQIVVRRTCVS